MSQHEQTKEQFMEALFELIDHGVKKMKQARENGLEGTKPLPETELSPMAKEALEYLKENPELAKQLIQKVAGDEILKHYELFNQYNKESLEKIGEIKQAIDVSTNEGKELIGSLAILEKRHLDKQNEVNQIVGKFSNDLTKPSMGEKENGLNEQLNKNSNINQNNNENQNEPKENERYQESETEYEMEL